MNLQHRINLFVELGNYLKTNDPEWQEIKEIAYRKNNWFSPPFIDIAVKNITDLFLDKTLLQQWVEHYHLDDAISPKNVGIVMAGNIPLVGFHDFLSVLISGHYQTIKLSSKDDVLLKHLIKKLYSYDIEIQNVVSIAENLKGCDAYIATGSNNSSRYFEQYFSKYPNIIRKNKTSVAVLDGSETDEELHKLSDDIHLYFGLGCRNVTKLYVPRNYDFVPLLQAFNKYVSLKDEHKYVNNFDFQLSLLLLNNAKYMTNGTTLLVESNNLFSPISVVHFEYYDDPKKLQENFAVNTDIQCVVGKHFVPFGQAQEPGLFSYADKVDTMQFLLSL
ncbi:MAG: acyl-CoA reductase [Bacteroidetes bacterium]|nr:acyl-CoA reductase [Bacteroidota bacterium]